MKKIDVPLRKHGYKAREASLEKLVLSPEQGGGYQQTQAGARLKTLLTFQSQSQVYLWTTDRGRSRLIKH